MFHELQEILRRPAPFEDYTAPDLWCDEHTSAQMLACHFDGTNDLSSRRGPFLDASTSWIAGRFRLSPGKAVLDLGCGPGHYTSRLAETGADVVGVDFSMRSLRHARESAAARGLRVEYVHADYLEVALERRFDLIGVIMCDVCALSPDQRSTLFQRARTWLRPGGALLFDVYSIEAFAKRVEVSTAEEGLLGGFWSAAPYVGFLRTFKYEDERVVLDKYTIIEETRTRVVLNWLQYFDPDGLRAELAAAGLEIEASYGDVSGAPYDPMADEFAVVARAR